MKSIKYLTFLSLLLVFACKKTVEEPKQIEEEVLKDYSSLMQVESGKPVSVMLTSYSTTLVADGKEETRLRVAVIDSLNREITSAEDSIQIFVTGKGKVKTVTGEEFTYGKDSLGNEYAKAKLENGIFNLLFVAGDEPDKVKVEVKSGKLWPGAHEIHTIPSTFVYKTPTEEQLPETVKPIDRMIGADISWLPQLENRGRKFYENGEEIDAMLLLKKHGFNYIRLRLFVNPENEKGYSPNEGFCDLEHTIAIAKRIKAAEMKFLLDFHYSDYWADPQQQNKPKAWEGLSFDELEQAVTDYTTNALQSMKNEGVFPDMVQVGNEINPMILQHGDLVWPIDWNRNSFLINKGIQAVRTISQERNKEIGIMLHIAQPENALWWFEQASLNGVTDYDWIGISYYPIWSTYGLNNVGTAISTLINTYNKDLMVVETAYPYTLIDTDNANNILNQDALVSGYPATQQGQLDYLNTLQGIVETAGGKGVVYWEPAWVSTNCSTLWAQGSHWDNATLFDHDNKATLGMQFYNGSQN